MTRDKQYKHSPCSTCNVATATNESVEKLARTWPSPSKLLACFVMNSHDQSCNRNDSFSQLPCKAPREGKLFNENQDNQDHVLTQCASTLHCCLSTKAKQQRHRSRTVSQSRKTPEPKVTNLHNQELIWIKTPEPKKYTPSGPPSQPSHT